MTMLHYLVEQVWTTMFVSLLTICFDGECARLSNQFWWYSLLCLWSRAWCLEREWSYSISRWWCCRRLRVCWWTILSLTPIVVAVFRQASTLFARGGFRPLLCYWKRRMEVRDWGCLIWMLSDNMIVKLRHCSRAGSDGQSWRDWAASLRG